MTSPRGRAQTNFSLWPPVLTIWPSTSPALLFFHGPLVYTTESTLGFMVRGSFPVSATGGPFRLAEEHGSQAELSASVYPLVPTCTAREAQRRCLLSAIPTSGEMCDVKLSLRVKTILLCLCSAPRSVMYPELSPGHRASHDRARLQSHMHLTT